MTLPLPKWRCTSLYDSVTQRRGHPGGGFPDPTQSVRCKDAKKNKEDHLLIVQHLQSHYLQWQNYFESENKCKLNM